MNFIPSTHVYWIFAGFAVFMLGLVWLRNVKTEQHAESFLVADRNLSSWSGAFSIAVSWVWAPAIFICSLQAYTKGLAGIFWFTLPNILCFFTFAAIAYKIRQLSPNGYSLPDTINKRFKNDKFAHISFLILAFGYQLGAIIINAVAGGTLLSLVSGISANITITAMVALALCYSLISGLKASVFTDIIQMLILLVFGFILVPWAIINAGGWSSVTEGFSGITGEFGTVFHPGLAFAMGIPLTISLIAGPISDQMFYQRAMAVKKDQIVSVFVKGGILFAIVPITLSLLGFIGVSLSQQQGLIIADPQMVSPIVIATLLPDAALYLFILMAFAGLCSTMDSAFCGISSLAAIDVYKRYFNPKAKDKDLLSIARKYMIFGALISLAIALMQPKLFWVFFICGAIAGAGLVPTVAALFLQSIKGKDVYLAIILSLIISMPISFYANISENEALNVVAALSGPVIGLVICVLSWLSNKYR